MKKPEKVPAVRSVDIDQPDTPYYELFPEDGYMGEGEWTPLDPSKVNVRVYRSDGTSNPPFLGRHTAEELPDERALCDLYGGGKYVLVAVWNSGKQKGQVARRRLVTLPGEQKGTSPATATAAPAVASPNGRSAAELAIAFATIVLPPLFAYLQHGATLAQQQRASDATLAQQQQQAFLEQQRTLHESFANALRTFQPAPAAPPAAPTASPPSAIESIKEMVECMKTLGFKKDESDLLEDMVKAMLPMAAMKFMGGMGGLPPGLGGMMGGAAPALAN
jgi:hypothetical protein